MSITPKGEARRQALLDAVLRVLEKGGPSAVTHRAVAAEAGVPLAAATYYFDDLDDLLVSALRRATEQQLDLFAPLAGARLGDFARALLDYTHTHRAEAIAQYELLFMAMRRDSLKGDAELWYGALDDAVRAATGDRLDEARRRGVSWAVDGLILHMLWRGEPSNVEAVEGALRDILGPQSPRDPRDPT
ncbi:TetR/AcrR family transcriptional regulator [Compostimonas suwonensis]|uniref:DNA-binding transcriptional regulator YbjK n=1 Tax=Compostimonas suwonensis TaxID=1048394 RepID=A0A2M9BUK6_9MICO|nr:TetR family transcriptional regulator [Compostimonas suwonensis]PJJ61634.1 DNA-binding transcriptional regulator YbjK [Compostimonas suwonensis]